FGVDQLNRWKADVMPFAQAGHGRIFQAADRSDALIDVERRHWTGTPLRPISRSSTWSAMADVSSSVSMDSGAGPPCDRLSAKRESSSACPLSELDADHTTA